MHARLHIQLGRKDAAAAKRIPVCTHAYTNVFALGLADECLCAVSWQPMHDISANETKIIQWGNMNHIIPHNRMRSVL